MKHIKRTAMMLIFIFTFLSLSGCSKAVTTNEPLIRTELVIGTVCKITLYDHQNEDTLDKAFSRLSELENILSINKTGTELDEVNANAGIKAVKVSSDTLNVIKKGLEYSKLSNGYLDITVGPLVKLWGIGTDNARVPSQEEIDEAKALVNYNWLHINEEDSTVFLEKEGMIIDLGAIAKGYAADEISELLKANNVESALIDLGGNVFTLGTKADGSLWKVGVQNPEKARNDTIGLVTVADKSVVTSGVYERVYEDPVTGKSYHHILNPFTGYPYDNNILGVSIISDKSIDGDSLSTTLFALGIDEGLELINDMDGVEALYITRDHELYLSEGFKDIFTLTNTEYNIK